MRGVARGHEHGRCESVTVLCQHCDSDSDSDFTVSQSPLDMELLYMTTTREPE
ncbi:hypothetical protein J6590_023606 [Homalodisca vitripennis]|nr:hypothetical protein J6590_023606 [Homalodisca vitripennis]